MLPYSPLGKNTNTMLYQVVDESYEWPNLHLYGYMKIKTKMELFHSIHRRMEIDIQENSIERVKYKVEIKKLTLP